MHIYVVLALSLKENNYFIIFVDHLIRRIWVYFIKEKYDAFIIF
jgi:hypothetical protein